jgi:ABC-type antimicrobial peptide transport system permease subunit
MGKALVWTATLVGLVPLVCVVVICICLLSAMPRTGIYRNIDRAAHVFVHDAYTTLGPWRIDLNPQYWSVGILIAGLAMVIVAMFSILQSRS